MRKRLAALLALSACWSTNTKDLERKVDVLSNELVASRAQVQTLQRKVGDLEADRDRNTELQAKIEKIDEKLGRIGSSLPPPTVSPPPPPVRRGPDPTKTYSVTLGTGHVDGPNDAKVTMIVFDEYACPYCEKARPTLLELRKKYGKELRVVYRQYVVHPRVATASALAICGATKQKKHDKLDALLWTKGFASRNYDQQITLPDGTTQECWTTQAGCPVVLGFAKEAGLDVARLRRGMAGACVGEHADSTKEVTMLGIAATPTFFINGRHISGSWPIETYTPVIDEELAKADERIRRGTKRATYYQEWVIDRGEKTLGP